MQEISNEIKLVIFDLDDTLMSRKAQDQMLSKNVIDIKAKDIIKYFKEKGCKIVLCSLNLMAAFYLYHNDILELFDFVITPKYDDECENQKEIEQSKSRNKSYMYKAIIKKFSISRKNIVIFDDSIWHKIEAKNYNINFVQINPKLLITWNDVKIAERLFNHPGVLRRNNSL